MYPFVETIRIEEGAACLIALHEERLNRTRREAIGCSEPIMLAPILEQAWREYADTNGLPVNVRGTSAGRPPADRHADAPRTPLYKCRVIYNKEIERIEFAPYAPPLITSLLLVEADDLDYTYKSTNRIHLNALHSRAVEQGASDALIIRHGLVTDSTFCNVAFSTDGRTWITPAQPLLRGVMREHLLRTDRIVEGHIAVEAIRDYRLIALFNAMNDLGGMVVQTSDLAAHDGR